MVGAKFVSARVGFGALVFLLTASSVAAQLPLETAEVILERLERERLWDGTVEAVFQSTVSAQTSGRVAEILYDVDDFVPAGSVILRFTDQEQRAALRRAEASLDEARAAFDDAKKELARISELFERRVIAKVELDRATARRDAAKARVDSARAQVDTAGEQLGYTVVKAPYAGIVTARHVQVGESVSVGQRLMTGLSLDVLRVQVDLPQGVVQQVRRIRKASIVMPETGDRVPADQVVIFPYADPASKTFRVRLELPRGLDGLYPGMFVKAAFVIGDAERIVVPATSVVFRSEVTGVYVVDGDVRFRQVRIGNRYGDRFEVLAGLVAGDRVALDPVRAGVVLKQLSGGD